MTSFNKFTATIPPCNKNILVVDFSAGSYFSQKVEILPLRTGEKYKGDSFLPILALHGYHFT